ncbi:MAG: type II toxin-antitoxin system Phd/YefM family antitoxin [Armatimonadetes bacterium]|nr:type II toxin-antitoxin system Phd/YefM family antitoxin [Armatimonadota bacterium]
MPEVTVTDVARNLADYLNRVAYRGESFILTRGKRPVAELRPAPIGLPLRELPELMAGLPQLGEADANDFAIELEAARKELDAVELCNPWRS